MAKRLTSAQQRAQHLKDAPSIYRTLFNMYSKNTRGISKNTITQLKQAQSDLRGRRKLSESENGTYSKLLEKIKREREVSSRVQREYEKKMSEQRLEEKTARKVMAELDTIKSPKEKAKRRQEIYNRYEKSYAEDIQNRVENLKDRDYKRNYYSYSTEEKQDILRRMLGIGSRGITLADGSTFTVEEFNEILERHNIPLERFTDKEDITKERYKQVKYTEWKASIDSELRELANLSDLTDREREGVRKMLKIYGT